MDIVTLGDYSLAQEMNYLIGPYHEFDPATDINELAYRLPYRDAVVVDLDHAELICECHELLRKAPLVIVLTNANGDMRDMKDILEGFNCRFLQKPVTKSGWEQALNPEGRMSLMVPDIHGNVKKTTVETNDVPPKRLKRRGRPKGSKNKKKS